MIFFRASKNRRGQSGQDLEIRSSSQGSGPEDSGSGSGFESRPGHSRGRPAHSKCSRSRYGPCGSAAHGSTSRGSTAPCSTLAHSTSARKCTAGRSELACSDAGSKSSARRCCSKWPERSRGPEHRWPEHKPSGAAGGRSAAALRLASARTASPSPAAAMMTRTASLRLTGIAASGRSAAGGRSAASGRSASLRAQHGAAAQQHFGSQVDGQQVRALWGSAADGRWPAHKCCKPGRKPPVRSNRPQRRGNHCPTGQCRAPRYPTRCQQ